MTLRRKVGTEIALALAAIAACAACSAPPRVVANGSGGEQEAGRVVAAPTERLAALARDVLASGCEVPVPRPPIPSVVGREDADRDGAHAAADRSDLVVYTAHPDDEAMYGGSTMDAVVRAGHRVSLVVMSHGEGGRLLELGADGGIVERRDRTLSEVAALRDRELAAAVARVGVSAAHLYTAEDRVDYGWTTSCSEVLAKWDAALPGGLAVVLERLVDDMRTRRPRVVMTLDPRDDPQSSHHGHHRAVGVLVELAARAAADPAVTGKRPHTIEELVAFAPADAPADIVLEVGAAGRLAMLAEYPSQFRTFDDLARRSAERFVVRWRARGTKASPQGSLLAQLAGQ